MGRATVGRYNKVVFNFTQNLSSVNLTTAYVQISASLTENVHALLISAKSGENGTVQIATGAAASEVALVHAATSGSILIPIEIGVNTRLAVNAPLVALTSGSLQITGLSEA